MLQVGSPAPDFALPDQDGRVRRLTDLRGSWVVLYFYPEDDTPGCTKEACAFRDALPHFSGLDAVVLGVSPDDVDSHRAFAEKYGLSFPLLADVDRSVLDAYEAWGPRKRSDGTFKDGVLRVTYLIDPQGLVAQTWHVEEPAEHADEVKAALARHTGRTTP